MVSKTLEDAKQRYNAGGQNWMLTYDDPTAPGVYLLHTKDFGNLCQPPMSPTVLRAFEGQLGSTWQIEQTRLPAPAFMGGSSIVRITIKSLDPERPRDDAGVLTAIAQAYPVR